MTEELPVHPRTGLTALAVLDSGRIVWPALGGAPDDQDEGQDDNADDDQDQDDDADEDAENGDQDDDADEDQDDDKPLGPKGEKALAAIKAKLKAERTRRRAAEAKLAKPAEGDDKASTDQIRKDAEDAATARANARIVRSEIKAAAAGKLADPKDALVFLDLDQFEVDEDGEVDEDEIADAIEDLLKRKPHLAATQRGGKRFQGGADGGARKGATKPITEEQLSKMTPAQIDEAYAKGLLKHLL